MQRPLTREEQDWVERTFASMSLREKIGQTMQDHAGRLPFKGNDEQALTAYLKTYPVGSFFIGGEVIQKAAGKAEEYRDWAEQLQRISKYPLLFSGDLEFGAGSAVKSLTAFPPLLGLAAADDEALAYEYGKFTALEGRAAGFTWALAPGTDLLLNWMNPVITTRCLGDDAKRAARLAGAVMRGMQDHGLAACAKHFPGDGVDYRDQHIVTTINGLSEEEWFAAYGQVSQHMIDQGVLSYMTGHIALPWLEGVRRKRSLYRQRCRNASPQDCCGSVWALQAWCCRMRWIWADFWPGAVMRNGWWTASTAVRMCCCGRVWNISGSWSGQSVKGPSVWNGWMPVSAGCWS